MRTNSLLHKGKEDADLRFASSFPLCSNVAFSLFILVSTPKSLTAILTVCL